MYTVFQKPDTQYYVSWLSQMWTNFSNSFTVAFLDELQKRFEKRLPSHLKSVAELPCEIWMFNSANVQHVIQCKCDAKSFIYCICRRHNVKFCFLCLRRWIYDVAVCVKIACPQHTRMLCKLRKHIRDINVNTQHNCTVTDFQVKS